MKLSRKTKERIAFVERVILSLGVIALLHILFALMLGMLTRHQDTQVVEVEKPRPQRFWYVPTQEGDLMPAARDFLHMNRLMSINRKAGFIPSQTAPAVVSEAMRMDWGAMTFWLDGQLPQWTVDMPTGYNWRNYSMLSERMYQLMHNRPLLAYNLAAKMADSERIQVAPLVPKKVRLQLAVITCYADSEWQAIEDDGLGKAALPIVTELSNALKDDSMNREFTVFAELTVPTGRAPRIHLRKSSGDRRLDDLTMNWLLARHAWNGHHGTDENAEAGGHVRTFVYQVEFRVPYSRKTDIN